MHGSSGMPASSAHRRMLKTTVAAAAAGAVAFAPLAPLAQEAAGPLDPVTIRVGQTREFTRVEFAGVIGARSQVRRDGKAVIVRIGATAAPDVSRLKVQPPPGVDKVETRAVQGGTELVLTLKDGADARTGAADGAVWLNLYETAPPAAAAPQAAAQQAVVPVTAQADAAQATLRFAWSESVGAAVFRRGEAVWVVFDAPARLDASKARATGPVKDLRAAVGDDHLAVRLAAPKGLAVTAEVEGSAWVVRVGGEAKAGEGVEVMRADDGEAQLVAQMAGATRVVWLTDPLVGDRFAAVTARAPGKGLGETRSTVDLTLLPTAHGLAVETAREDLAIKADGDRVVLSRSQGLVLSPPSAGLEAAEPLGPAVPKKAPLPGLILAEWADQGHAGFSARHRELQDAAAKEALAAGEDPKAPVEGRLALARFLVGSGLNYEAIGVLNALVKAAPNLSGEPEVRGLRGAARAAIGRHEEAAADLASGALSGDPATKVWQGYLASKAGDWAEARRGFAAGAGAVDQFPSEWRARFAVAHAQAALEEGDKAAAEQLLAYAFGQQPAAGDEMAARLIQARLMEANGDAGRALAIYKQVAQAPVESLAVAGQLGVVRLSLADGSMAPPVAAKTLESLKWRWRGDATELEVIRTLGRLYMDQGLYREALTALRGAGPNLNRLWGAADLQADLQNAFRALFLEGGADGLQPVQALGLFYDFRELTPVGADGDEMVRRLSRRLVDVDLLDQAAELLKYQVDNRLEGVAKASVATDLATIYLMDRQPEPALQAIWTSRTTLLPTAMQAERRALEARALMELGRFDHALEVLGADASPAAREVRAEVFWKQQNWVEAARLYEARLGDRHKTPGPLKPDEEGRLIRAGIGYSLGRDGAAVARLARTWGGFIEGARNPAALRIALDGLTGMEGGVSATDFAGLNASADTFAGWVGSAKQAFRQKQTGGNGPAAPARP